MERTKKVFTKVEALYLASTSRDMGQWMWHNHVQWVANKSKKLAEKYNADVIKVYCSALLHDLADCQFERNDKNFDSWSKNKSGEILTEAGFLSDEIQEILEVIIHPHSCRPDNLPITIEGKVLATADAMFHLQTNFFSILCYKQRPEYTNTYEEWQKWFTEKIARDFGPKIFFEDERAEVGEDYKALCRVFGNKSLHG